MDIKTVKKSLKFLLYWCVPGLLMLPIGGCFTAMSHFMDRSPNAGEAVVAGTLDVVTMPVQIVVFVPMIAQDFISKNTGERGRRRREAKRRREEVEHFKEMLTSDFSQVFRNDEFLSITNTPARDALHDWLCAYGINQPPREAIDSFVERLITMPEVAVELTPVFEQRNLSGEMKKRLCLSLVEYVRSHASDKRSSIMYWADKILSDEELKGLISASKDDIGSALEDILRKREERRERARKEAAERAARKRAQAAERQKLRERENRLRQQRMKELREAAKKIDSEGREFETTLSLRRELIVAQSWSLRLSDASKSLPPENVRMLARVLTERNEPMNMCYRHLFRRTELTDEDLRGLYARLLEKMNDEDGEWKRDGWKCAGALIKNPNFPPDLARACYKEPILSELREIYIIHHSHSLNIAMRELREFGHKCHDLKHDFFNGKIAFDKFNASRFKLTRRYLPDECPDDWVRSIP